MKKKIASNKKKKRTELGGLILSHVGLTIKLQ